MDLGMTGAGDPPRQEDDEPLLARTGRPTKPDPVTLNRAVRSRIRRALGVVVLWALLVAASLAGLALLVGVSDRLLTDVSAWVAGEGQRPVLVAPRGNGLYAIPLNRSSGWSPITSPQRERNR